jgi:hypothetical protein
MGLVVSFFLYSFKETPFWEKHYTISLTLSEFIEYIGPFIGYISASFLSLILCTL